MTWTRVKSTGSGKVEFRLSIEGLDHEFVTSKSMIKAAIPSTDNQGRYLGLKRNGLRFQYSSDIPSAKIKAGGMSLTIADIDGRATTAFSRASTVSTYLIQDCNKTATIIYVSSTSGLAVDDHIHINTECMRITGFSNEDPNQVNVSRAKYDTENLFHYTENGYQLRLPEVTNYPSTLEGRRVRIFAYGEGDSPTGNGTQIFLGIVRTDPQLLGDVSSWRIDIDPITRILDQDLGWDPKAKLGLRGIYYPWNRPLVLAITETDNSSASTTSGTNAAGSPFVIIGHFETQQALCDELNSQISGAATAAFQGGSGCIHFEVVDNDNIRIYYKTGATPRFVRIATYFQGPYIHSLDGAGAGDGADHWFLNGSPDKNLNASTLYYVHLKGSVPRSAGMQFDDSSIPVSWQQNWDASQASTAPNNRMYLDGELPFDIVGATSVAVENSMDTYQWPATWAVTVNGGSSRYIDVSIEDANRTAATLIGSTSYTGKYNLPAGSIFDSGINGAVQETSAYSLTVFADTVSGSTNLSEYLSQIAADSQTYCTIGLLPFFTSTDYNESTSTTNIDAARTGKALANNRGYSLFQRRTMADVIAEECKLIGCYPALDSSGKIVIRRITVPTSTMTASSAITSENTILTNGMPSYERNANGLINTVTFETSYDIYEDKHGGSPITVRDIVALGQNRTPKSMKVSPYSEDPTVPQYNDVVGVATEYFAMFGSPYVILTVDVPLTLHDSALVGTICSLVSAQLPDEQTGTRGWTTAKNTLVIGTDWDYESGIGTLTLYMPLIRTAGYTPSVRITARTNTSGNIWSLDISDANWSATSTSYWDTGATLASQFPVGTRVKVFQWDNSSPTELAGTVTSLTDTDTLVVTFDGVWTPGTISTTNAWNLGYDVATSSGLTSGQKLYAYIAGTDNRIDFSTTTNARVFSA